MGIHMRTGVVLALASGLLATSAYGAPPAYSPPTPAPASYTSSTAIPTAYTPSTTQSDSGLGTQRVLAIVSGGLGVTLLTFGTVESFVAKSNQDDARAHCIGTVCADQAGVNATKDAAKASTLATAGIVAGAVGIAAGVTLWLTAPDSTTTPRVGIAPGRIVLRGSF